MDSKDKVDIGMIIRDVTVSVGDPDLKKGLTRGWYRTQIRICLDKLAFKLKFDDLDVTLDYPNDTNMLSVPDGLFDLQEMYLLTGTEPTFTSSTPVWWKRRLNTSATGQSWTAMRTVNGAAFDPFNPFDFVTPLLWVAGMPVLFANIENGVIKFDDACSAYDKVKLVYSGSYGSIDEVPCIPRPFYDCIAGWLKWKFYAAMDSREPRYGWGRLKNDAWNEMYNTVSGTFWDAQKFVRQMDGWQKNSFSQYSSRGNW